MEKSRITADQLSQKLANARKVMKKVETGDFEKGAVSENMKNPPKELVAENQPVTAPVSASRKATVDPDRINQSKLPDAIKKAMLENPIPQIGLDDTLDMDFVAKTRKLMEQDGTMPANKGVVTETTQDVTPRQTTKTTTVSSGDLARTLTPIIENIIRKTLDEIVDRKLTQLLAAQVGSTINENLAIKVGDTIFTGKITKSKSAK